MKTFSRRAKRAAQEELIGTTTDHQPNSEPSPYDKLFLSEDQQEAVLESLSAKPSLRQPSPSAKLAPTRPLKAEPANKKPPGAASGGSRGRQPSQQGPKLEQKPAGGKSSGWSIGSGLRVGASKPEKPAATKGSGRLLGGYKSSRAAASPSPKRKASSSQVAQQEEALPKKQRAPTAAKPAVPTAAPPLAAKAASSSAPPAAVPPVLPAAMARLLGPAALRESAPAQTVMQAQELGEQSRYRDDAMWALDGLCMSGGSANTQRESVVALLDICASRKGRLALRSGGVAEEVVATLGRLKLQDDAVLALGAAAVLACFCQADADLVLLAKEETAQLMTALLKVEESVPSNSAPASFAGRVVKVLREGPLGRLLPQEETTSPVAVVLAAVAGLLDPNQRCANMDPCKQSLRGAGTLAQVAQLAADHAQALSDAVPTMHTVRALWKLNKCLLVLENVCFACPDNEAHLASLAVVVGRTAGADAAGAGKEVGLAEWLVQQLELLVQQGVSGGFKKDCLRALLAVLMNMTQNNPAGCKGVVSVGALEAAAPILSQIVQGGPRNRGCLRDRSELEAWVDELSCCLGLLINLVESQPGVRPRLRSLQLRHPPATAAASSSSLQQRDLVSLLCALISSVIPPSRYLASSEPRRQSEGEITVESLEGEEEEGAGGGAAASIVEVYASILLGFLVEGCPQAHATAAALLPTGSLELLASAVRRCLHFYVSAGAMTKGNEDSLRALLASLEAAEAVKEGEAEEEGGEGGD